MEFRFGADIQRRDGDVLGSLVRIIYDPSTGQVTGLVARAGDAGDREVRVPIGAVAETDQDIVYVELSREQWDSLDNIVIERNLAPPPSLDNIDEDQVTDPVDVPDVPPIGAASGIESIAFTPIIEESLDVPPGDELLDSATVVWAGKTEIGVLRAVTVSDETERITSVVVGGDAIPGGVAVPVDWIVRVGTGTIVLSRGPDEVVALAGD